MYFIQTNTKSAKKTSRDLSMNSNIPSSISDISAIFDELLSSLVLYGCVAKPPKNMVIPWYIKVNTTETYLDIVCENNPYTVSAIVFVLLI